jgi:hypothetical protein
MLVIKSNILGENASKVKRLNGKLHRTPIWETSIWEMSKWERLDGKRLIGKRLYEKRPIGHEIFLTSKWETSIWEDPIPGYEEFITKMRYTPFPK